MKQQSMTTPNEDHIAAETTETDDGDTLVAEDTNVAEERDGEASGALSEGEETLAPEETEALTDDGAADDSSAGEDETDAADEDDSEDELLLTGDIEEDDEDDALVIHDADAEDAAEEEERLLAEMRAQAKADAELAYVEEDVAPGGGERGVPELMAMAEALIYVSDEPLPIKTLADVLDEEYGWVSMAVEELAREFNERNGGLMMREVAGGWQIVTRPEYHEQIRAFLRSRPSAKLSLAALETLAVIAYKQPITVPEILEIRGVQSSSAIKTLLDKRLIIAKGRKETVGRPMLYGTSKEFLMQFGLRDLTELPSIEDFEDLAGGAA